jgi:hypothetical protein
MSNVTKMNTEQEGQTSFVKSSKNSPDMELVQEKSEKLKPFWKLIDNKIVRVTYTEEQIENAMQSFVSVTFPEVAKSVAFHKLGRDSEVFNFEFPANIPCFVSSVDFIGVISITGS